MPVHKMVTIDGVRVRAEDEARYRARTGAQEPAVIGMRQADPEEKPDPAAPEPDPSPTPQQDPEEPGPLFDPSAHGVPEVLAYLETADATERARVLDAEAAGKGRKTIAEKGNPTT